MRNKERTISPNNQRGIFVLVLGTEEPVEVVIGRGSDVDVAAVHVEIDFCATSNAVRKSDLLLTNGIRTEGITHTPLILTLCGGLRPFSRTLV